MSQFVAPTLISVAIPFCAKVRVPVVALLANVSVSAVIPTDSEELLPLMMTIVEPVGNATEELAGMVNVRLVPFM